MTFIHLSRPSSLVLLTSIKYTFAKQQNINKSSRKPNNSNNHPVDEVINNVSRESSDENVASTSNISVAEDRKSQEDMPDELPDLKRTPELGKIRNT